MLPGKALVQGLQLAEPAGAVGLLLLPLSDSDREFITAPASPLCHLVTTMGYQHVSLGSLVECKEMV